MKEFDYITKRNKMYLDEITKLTKQAQEKGILKPEKEEIEIEVEVEKDVIKVKAKNKK